MTSVMWQLSLYKKNNLLWSNAEHIRMKSLLLKNKMTSILGDELVEPNIFKTVF